MTLEMLHNKVFSLFSFLLLILGRNWVLLGDETHMANLLSPTQVGRVEEKAQSMTGLSCLMNHPKASAEVQRGKVIFFLRILLSH